jgi:hypothetical protein
VLIVILDGFGKFASKQIYTFPLLSMERMSSDINCANEVSSNNDSMMVDVELPKTPRFVAEVQKQSNRSVKASAKLQESIPREDALVVIAKDEVSSTGKPKLTSEMINTAPNPGKLLNPKEHTSLSYNPVDGASAEPSSLSECNHQEETPLIRGSLEQYLRNIKSSVKVEPCKKEKAVVSTNYDINKQKPIKQTIDFPPAQVSRFRRLSTKMELRDLQIRIPPYINKKPVETPVSRFRRLSEKMELKELQRKVPPYISDMWKKGASPLSGNKSKIKSEEEVRTTAMPDEARSMYSLKKFDDGVDISASHKSGHQNKATLPPARRKMIDPKKQKEFELRSRYSLPFRGFTEDMTERRLSYTSLVYKNLNYNYGPSTAEERDIKLVKAVVHAKLLMRKINFQIQEKDCKEFGLYCSAFYREICDFNCGSPKTKNDANNIFAVGEPKVAQLLNQKNVFYSPWSPIRKRRFSISYIDMPKKQERHRSMSVCNLQVPSASISSSASRSARSSRKSNKQFKIGTC